MLKKLLLSLAAMALVTTVSSIHAEEDVSSQPRSGRHSGRPGSSRVGERDVEEDEDDINDVNDDTEANDDDTEANDDDAEANDDDAEFEIDDDLSVYQAPQQPQVDEYGNMVLTDKVLYQNAEVGEPYVLKVVLMIREDGEAKGINIGGQPAVQYMEFIPHEESGEFSFSFTVSPDILDAMNELGDDVTLQMGYQVFELNDDMLEHSDGREVL